MEAKRADSWILEPRQLGALRESLCADLARHADWADVWNAYGLLEAWEGRPREAAESFRRALERNPGFGTGRWNLRWADVLSGQSTPGVPPLPDHGATAAEQPGELLGAARNLGAGVTSLPRWEAPGPATRFFALALGATPLDEASMQPLLEDLRHEVTISSELLATAGLAHADGSLRLARLAQLGRPERMNPNYHVLFRRAARQANQAGRDGEARRLSALTALFSGKPAAYHVDLAEMAGRRGESDVALRLLERAAAEAPDWERPHLLLGYEHSAAGKPAAALPCLERASELRPRWPDVLYQLGLVRHALGRNDEAIATFERAISINPSYLVARIALANLLFESGRGGEAAPHYERILDEGVLTPTLVGQFGYALHAGGAQVRAEEIFLEALSRDPKRPEILALYGLFLAETDRKVEARAVWDRALGSGPTPQTRERIEDMRYDISVDD